MLVYLVKKLFHTAFLLSLGILFFSCSTTQQTDYEKEIEFRKVDLDGLKKIEGPRLSEALEKNLSSRTMDSIPSRRKAILKLLSQKSSSKSYRQCQEKYKDAPECAFLKPDWDEEFFAEDDPGESDLNPESEDLEEAAIKAIAPAPSKKGRSRSNRNRIVSELHQRLKKGEITELPNQQEGDYYRALKTFKEWSPALETVKETLLSGEYCSKIELYHYMGMKSEEFFPDEERILTSRKLYEKADQCGDKDSALQNNRYLLNARFRLGLLSLLNQDCSSASKVFDKLLKVSVNDFSSRAHYWKAYCSKVGAKREEFLSSYEQLHKLNPIGFHTLLMTRGESPLVQNLSQPVDPAVKLRTHSDPSFNTWIETIEDLDTLGIHQGVRRLLTPVRTNPEYLDSLEPGVRLYLATFAHRARDTFSVYRILDGVFRAQNEYVLDSTLRLFYPLKYIDSISQKVSKVNPFMITALIRQESAFHEEAKSKAGAIGLMQLMPRTARLFERKVSKKKLFEPETNLRIGIRFFENLVNRFEGDVELALAAYNAGPDAVERWRKRYPMTNRVLFLDLIPYAETRNYVSLIGRNYYWYSKVYSKDLKMMAENSSGGPVEFRSLNSHAK